MHTIVFKAGDTIIQEGDPGDTAYFVNNGTLEVSIGHGARAKVLGTLQAGEVFGEMCLIEPGPRSATVRALTDAECLMTSYEEFMATIEDNPKSAVEFMKTLVRRLRQMNDLIASMDPRKRGLRQAFGDWWASQGSGELDPEVVALAWMKVW